MNKNDETIAEIAIEAFTRNTGKKEWNILVKALATGIIIVCLGIPAFAFGGGYYFAEAYFKPKCICNHVGQN